MNVQAKFGQKPSSSPSPDLMGQKQSSPKFVRERKDKTSKVGITAKNDLPQRLLGVLKFFWGTLKGGGAI